MNAAGMLAGRAALVLGLDGTGAGIARRYAREGAMLGLADPLDPARAAKLATEFVATAIPTEGATGCDTHAVEALVTGSVRRLGRLDILVCNLLPPPRPRPLTDLAEEALDESLASVHATLAAMRSAFPALRDSGRGRIVLVGHRYGETVGEALGAYNTAAWALVGLARTAAVEWGQHQVATNVLLPLAHTAEFEAAQAKRPAVIARLVDQLPLRRVGDPVEDVGGAATLLASDLVCFVNGEVVHADGGQHVAGPVLNPARFAP